MRGKNRLNREGMTLIEMLVATAIFMIIVIVVVDLAILFNKNPEDMFRQKKLEREMDYTMEFIAQKIRTNKIDYDIYEGMVTDYLTKSWNNPSNRLYLYSNEDEHIYFAFDSNMITYYDSTGLSETLHSSDIIIDNAKFFIKPYKDPFIYDSTSGYSYNEQPRVVISLQAHHVSDTDLEYPLYLQTAITTRTYER